MLGLTTYSFLPGNAFEFNISILGQGVESGVCTSNQCDNDYRLSVPGLGDLHVQEKDVYDSGALSRRGRTEQVLNGNRRLSLWQSTLWRVGSVANADSVLRSLGFVMTQAQKQAAQNFVATH